MAPAAPNLFLLGAAKAGTSTLYDWLAAHPQVYMSPVKEPHHFTPAMPDGRPVPGAVTARAAYLALFADGAAQRWRGEASASYLHHGAVVVPAILRLAPQARFLVLLREPVARAWSHYLMAKRAGQLRRSFESIVAAAPALPPRSAAADCIEMGCYAEQLRAVLTQVPRERLWVGLQADLARAPAALAAGLAAFLEIDVAGFPAAAPRRNAHAAPRGGLAAALLRAGPARALRRRLPAGFAAPLRRLLLREQPPPPIPTAAAERLAAYYAPQLAELEALLGRSLPALYYRGGSGAQ